MVGRVSDGVSAHTAARVGSLSGGYHMMPWALLQGQSVCLNASGNAILNASCSVKVGAGGGITGWYGALDFDGNGGGASEYEANIIDGTTDWKYRIDGDPAPGCVSAVSVIDTLTGNKVGLTGIQIVDAAYSQAAGFLGAYDADSGITIRRLVELTSYSSSPTAACLSRPPFVFCFVLRNSNP